MKTIQLQGSDNLNPALTAMHMSMGVATPESVEQYKSWLATASVEEVASYMADSKRDDVTGLWGPKGLRELYKDDARNASMYEIPRAIFALMLDVEAMGYANSSPLVGFTSVNNNLLKPLGDALFENARCSDNVGRNGGDEFLVFGVSDNSETRLLPDVATRFAARSLGGLLSNGLFMNRRGYGLGSVGIVVKAASVPATTQWEDLTAVVDPKIGLTKNEYDVSKLPEAASLHRIYKDVENPFRRIGYLMTSSEGGYFAPFKDPLRMSRLLTYSNFDPSKSSRAIEIEAKDVPKPYN